MRVLLISHTCQSLREGQPKAQMLGLQPDVELTVLAPDRFKMYGKYTSAEPPTEPTSYRYEVGHIRWPSLGPAQFYLHYYPRLSKIIRESKPDVIDLWEEPWGLVSAHTVRLRNRLCPNVPIVSETEQNVDKRLPPPFEQMRSYTLRNAQYVVGRNAEAIAITRSRGYEGTASVVPNAVDDTLFRPLDRDQCRRELGVSGTVAAYIGRLVDEKGIDDILGALRRLPADVKLLIAGDGPRLFDLQAANASGELAGRIQLLGKRPLSELPQIMNAADVLLLPSRTTARWKEQFGRVIIEAHACGTPVIGSDSGAIPDVAGCGGLVVRESDPDALAAAIATIRNDPEGARRMGALGRERALRIFTWRAVADRMAEIYRQVTKAPTRVSAHVSDAQQDVYAAGDVRGLSS